MSAKQFPSQHLHALKTHNGKLPPTPAPSPMKTNQASRPRQCHHIFQLTRNLPVNRILRSLNPPLARNR